MTDGLADLWREHMRCADFEAAWRISDEAVQDRHRCARAHDYEDSTWGGEPADGKRILVRCCYGLGDTLQFIRYVPLLRRVALQGWPGPDGSACRSVPCESRG